MRYAIVADIHGNLEALQAVLDDIKNKGGVDGIWCLGDIVGYGPDPAACIGLVRQHASLCVAGNHDRAVIDKLDLAYFNPHGAVACRWTKTVLGEADLAYLQGLPLRLEHGEFLLIHGSPADPLLEYILSAGIAGKNFSFFESKNCLVGHTHEPMAFKEEDGDCLPVSLQPGIGMVLGAGRVILNPGSVGQPRDGDPRASYAIYDSDGNTVRVHRIAYDMESTQDKMMQAGLPVQLITRLNAGR